VKFFDRIANRTALFFCLAGLIPVALIAGLLCGRVFTIVERAAGEADQALVTSVEAAVDAHLSMFREQCTAVSYAPAVQSLDRARAQPVLAEFLTLTGTFLKFAVYDRDARLVDVVWRSRFHGEDRLIGQPCPDPALAAALAKVQATGEALWTDPTTDAFSQPVLYLVTPVRHFVHEERITGTLVAAVSLDGHRIQDLLDRARLPAHAYAAIVDDGGQILARRGEGLAADADTYAAPRVPHGRVTVGGQEMLASAARLASVGLTLVVGRPAALVMAPAHDAVYDVLLLAALAAVFALALSVWLSRGFVRPLYALVDGIRKVAAGELAWRVPVERPDELGAAAGAFNDMAGELEKQRLVEEIWTEEWRPPEP
jgi:HAMP domain-containing protein